MPVTGVTIGNTTLHAGATGIATVAATIKVTAAPPISINDATVGKDLQVALSGTLGAAAPAGNLQVTITSADPSRVLLSTDAATAGSASITLQVNAGSASIPTFYIQALAGSGTVQITASAPGYATDTSTITLMPSGFYIYLPGDFTTTTFAANTTLTIHSVRLDPTTLQRVSDQPVRGGLMVDVPVTSSNTTVGTITSSPVVFTGGTGSATTQFDPQNAGTAVISLRTPAGFKTPLTQQQITATVTAPNINMANVTVGEDLQAGVGIRLESAPPNPVDVTVTSNDGTIALVSKNGTVAGGTSVTFNGVTGTTVGTVYVQGLKQGSTTLQVQATGYNDATPTVTVTPSAFYFYVTSDFTTNTFAANTTLTIHPAQLNPTTLQREFDQAVRGGLTVDVPVTSSDTTVGLITTSPVVFTGGTFSATTQFDPQTAGAATLALTQPSGFDILSNARQQLTATVRAPNINMVDVTVGEDLQAGVSISLESAPPNPVDVTVTSASGTIALVSQDGTKVDETSVTFNGVTGTSVGTVTATVANRTLTIHSTRLDPTTLNTAISQQPVRGGLTVRVDVTSSDTTVGTITTSPVVFAGNTSSVTTQFDPKAAGTAVISVEPPTGFDPPSNYRQITATVNP